MAAVGDPLGGIKGNAVNDGSGGAGAVNEFCRIVDFHIVMFLVVAGEQFPRVYLLMLRSRGF